MRLFAYLFSIYVLALSIMPCGDVDLNCKTNEVTLQNKVSNHTTHQNEICSPFCNCSCCGATAHLKSNPIKSQIGKLKMISTLKFSFWNPSFVSNYQGDIWQPPKITV